MLLNNKNASFCICFRIFMQLKFERKTNKVKMFSDFEQSVSTRRLVFLHKYPFYSNSYWIYNKNWNFWNVYKTNQCKSCTKSVRREVFLESIWTAFSLILTNSFNQREWFESIHRKFFSINWILFDDDRWSLAIFKQIYFVYVGHSFDKNTRLHQLNHPKNAIELKSKRLSSSSHALINIYKIGCR